MRRGVQAVALAALALTAPRSARGADLDLDLGRFVSVTRDDQGRVTATTPDDARFYSLASELGVLISPKLLAPAETTGYNGFSLDLLQFGVTTISADEDFWDAAEVVDPADRDARRPPSSVSTVGMFVRKGIWFPVPSFELGTGLTHIPSSSMFALQLSAKLALHEGFQDLALPSIAVRGTGARLMGAPDLDLTTAGLDISVSKKFAIGGTVGLTPYAGWQFLWIVARSKVMDATPGTDAYAESIGAAAARDVGGQDWEAEPGHRQPFPPIECGDDDCNANFIFFDPDPILRQRFFFGLRFVLNPVSFAVEGAFALKGSSGECARFISGQACAAGADISDRAGSQQTYAAKVGLDF